MDKNLVLQNTSHHSIPARQKWIGIGEGSLAVLLLAERARKECAHMGQGRVLARPRRAGEKMRRSRINQATLLAGCGKTL